MWHRQPNVSIVLQISPFDLSIYKGPFYLTGLVVTNTQSVPTRAVRKKISFYFSDEWRTRTITISMAFWLEMCSCSKLPHFFSLPSIFICWNHPTPPSVPADIRGKPGVGGGRGAIFVQGIWEPVKFIELIGFICPWDSFVLSLA